MTSTESTEPKGSDDSSTELFAPGAEEYYRKVLGPPSKKPEQRDSCPPACAEAHAYSGSCLLRASGPCDCRYRHGDMPSGIHEGSCRTQQAPPLAPEEEACNAFVSRDHCLRCKDRWSAQLAGGSLARDAPPPPPQPLRRPPYAVAYSVAGHLYEIALPGDATVHATDGGLIITHTLGPVAGVVRVHPIEGEQSA